MGYYYRDTTIDVGYLLNLGWNYRDYSVDYVEVRVRNANGRSAMILFVNNWEEDSAVPTRSYDIYRLQVRGLKRINREILSLNLRIDGTLYIESISAALRYEGRRW